MFSKKFSIRPRFLQPGPKAKKLKSDTSAGKGLANKNGLTGKGKKAATSDDDEDEDVGDDDDDEESVSIEINIMSL